MKTEKMYSPRISQELVRQVAEDLRQSPPHGGDVALYKDFFCERVYPYSNGSRINHINTRDRCKLKANINEYYERQKVSCRLFTRTGHGFQFAVDGESCQRLILENSKRTADRLSITQRRAQSMSLSRDLTSTERKMMGHFAKYSELAKDAFIGAVARSRSIPKETKREMFKMVGFRQEEEAA